MSENANDSSEKSSFPKELGNVSAGESPVPRSLLYRLVRAGLVFLIFEMIIFAMVWKSYRAPQSWLRYHQLHTVTAMRVVIDDLKKYQQSNGTFPESLMDLKETEEQWLKDHWEKPFHYHSDGQHCEIVSLGADGQKGGVGLNTDLVISDTDNLMSHDFWEAFYEKSKPTFTETIRSPQLQSLMTLFSFLLIGVVVCIFFFYPDNQNSDRFMSGFDIFNVIMAILSLFVISVYISIQSCASGH